MLNQHPVYELLISSGYTQKRIQIIAHYAGQ
jgi:hypothetical protein